MRDFRVVGIVNRGLHDQLVRHRLDTVDTQCHAFRLVFLELALHVTPKRGDAFIDDDRDGGRIQGTVAFERVLYIVTNL
jgi:hypothetical protein